MSKPPVKISEHSVWNALRPLAQPDPRDEREGEPADGAGTGSRRREMDVVMIGIAMLATAACAGLLYALERGVDR